MEPEQVDALRAAVSRLSRRLRNEGSGTAPLSATGIAVLGRLRREGPLTLQALAAGEHVRPPTMTRIIDRLADLHMVSKQPNPNDGRSVIIHLHQAGEEYLADTVRHRSRWLNDRIDTLSPDEEDALRRAIPALQHLANLP